MKQKVLLTISELVINNQHCKVDIPLRVELEMPHEQVVPAFAHIAPKDYVHLAIEILAYDNVHRSVWLGCSTKQTLAQTVSHLVGWSVDRRALSQRLDDVDVRHHHAILRRIHELEGK